MRGSEETHADKNATRQTFAAQALCQRIRVRGAHYGQLLLSRKWVRANEPIEFRRALCSRPGSGAEPVRDCACSERRGSKQ